MSNIKGVKITVEFTSDEFADLCTYASWAGTSVTQYLHEIALRIPDSNKCWGCQHTSHENSECDAVTGYDHLNGDHECGCPGDDADLFTVKDDGTEYDPHRKGPL